MRWLRHSHARGRFAVKSASNRCSAHPRPRPPGSTCFHALRLPTEDPPRRPAVRTGWRRHSRGTSLRYRRALWRPEPDPVPRSCSSMRGSMLPPRAGGPTASRAVPHPLPCLLRSHRPRIRPTKRPRQPQGTKKSASIDPRQRRTHLHDPMAFEPLARVGQPHPPVIGSNPPAPPLAPRRAAA